MSKWNHIETFDTFRTLFWQVHQDLDYDFIDDFLVMSRIEQNDFIERELEQLSTGKTE